MKQLVSSVVVAVVAATATVHADPMWKMPPMVAVTSVTATSTYVDKHDAYAAWHALAYDYREQMGSPAVVWSAWCEGKPDEGIGEGITITLAAPTQIDAISLGAGVWRSDALFAANNQPTSLDVSVDGKPPTHVAIAGKRGADLTIGAKVSTIVVTIGAVKKGKMNDSCISVIDLMRGGTRLVPVVGVDGKGLAGLQAAVETINGALDARKGLEALLEFPFAIMPAVMANEGGGKLMTSRDLAAQNAACVEYAKRSSDVEPTNSACPDSVVVSDPEREMYGYALAMAAPGRLDITWPSHGETQVLWHLHWTGRWRLAGIDAVMH